MTLKIAKQMTNSNTQAAYYKKTDHFKQVYTFTLHKLYRLEHISEDAPLQILRLLTDNERNYAVHALELWLFCEARKICLTIKKTQLQQEAVYQQITQRFLTLITPKQHPQKAPQVQELVQCILKKMGF